MFRIISDFREPYDQYLRFLGDGELVRRTDSGMDRIEMFRYLESKNFSTVKHGYLDTLHDGPVVEYTDLRAHCGEGKILHQWNPKTPGAYGSEYRPHRVTERLLFIGSYAATVVYVRGSDWRSNHDPKAIYTSHAWEGKENSGPVLQAYDMVDNLICDYNIAPGLPEDLPWSWKEIAEEIYRWTRASADPLNPAKPPEPREPQGPAQGT